MSADTHAAPPPLPASPVDAVAALPLEYSHGDTASLEDARPALVAMAWLAVFSGLCVASCFLVIYSRFDAAAIAFHAMLYAVTLGLAVWGGVQLGRLDAPSLRSPLRPVLDCVAGVGLMMIGVAPLLTDLRHGGPEQFIAGFVGTAFLLVCVATPRHVLLYRGLADLVAARGRRRSAGWLRTLGWIKFLYEGVWLLCCSTPLLLALPLAQPARAGFEQIAIFMAIGALFGCIGFAVVWIMMMVTHGRLVALTRSMLDGESYGYNMPSIAPSVWANDTRRL